MTDLFLPFEFPFMQGAFLAGALVALPLALLSCVMVLRGASLMGDAITHATLPGIVLAWMAGLPLALGAFATGLGCALAVGALGRNPRLRPDTLTGVVFSGLFGVGLVLFAAAGSDLHLDHILFGNLLGVEAQVLWGAAAAAMVVAMVFALRWRDLMLLSFDPAQARALGMRTGLADQALLALVALAVVAALQAAGLILAIGLLILPGATAFLLARRFPAMLMIALGLTQAAMALGIWASFWLDSAPAATVTLALGLAFGLALAASLWRGAAYDRRASRA